MSAKSYASDFIYDKAQSEIAKAVALDESNDDYLGWYGLILLNTAQYTTALEYLQKSLKIQQEIGDKSGMCATFFNIGHIHLAQEETEEVIKSWVTVYTIAKDIEYAQALEALDELAKGLRHKGIGRCYTRGWVGWGE